MVDPPDVEHAVGEGVRGRVDGAGDGGPALSTRGYSGAPGTAVPRGGCADPHTPAGNGPVSPPARPRGRMRKPDGAGEQVGGDVVDRAPGGVRRGPEQVQRAAGVRAVLDAQLADRLPHERAAPGRRGAQPLRAVRRLPVRPDRGLAQRRGDQGADRHGLEDRQPGDVGLVGEVQVDGDVAGQRERQRQRDDAAVGGATEEEVGVRQPAAAQVVGHREHRLTAAVSGEAGAGADGELQPLGRRGVVRLAPSGSRRPAPSSTLSPAPSTGSVRAQARISRTGSSSGPVEPCSAARSSAEPNRSAMVAISEGFPVSPRPTGSSVRGARRPVGVGGLADGVVGLLPGTKRPPTVASEQVGSSPPASASRNRTANSDSTPMPTVAAATTTSGSATPGGSSSPRVLTAAGRPRRRCATRRAPAGVVLQFPCWCAGRCDQAAHRLLGRFARAVGADERSARRSSPNTRRQVSGPR